MFNPFWDSGEPWYKNIVMIPILIVAGIHEILIYWIKRLFKR